MAGTTPPTPAPTGLTLTPSTSLILFLVRQLAMTAMQVGVVPAESHWFKLCLGAIQVIDAVTSFLGHRAATEVKATRTGTGNGTG